MSSVNESDHTNTHTTINTSTHTTINESSSSAVIPIRITMLADWICAWCYIGHVIAESASQQLDSPFIHWRIAPFFLDGTLTDDPISTETYYQNKFKSIQHANTPSNSVSNTVSNSLSNSANSANNQSDSESNSASNSLWEQKKAAVLTAGERHGLHFDFTGKIASTMLAHRLVQLIDQIDQSIYQKIYRTINQTINQINQNRLSKLPAFRSITPKIQRNIFLLPLIKCLYSAFTEKRTPLSSIDCLVDCVKQINQQVCNQSNDQTTIDIDALVQQSTNHTVILDQLITHAITQSIKPIDLTLVREFLLSRDLTSTVQMGVINAYRAGITSIPYFKIDRIVDQSVESIIELAVEQAKESIEQPNNQPVDFASSPADSRARHQLLNQPLNQPLNSTINLSAKSEYEVVGGEKATIFEEIFEKMGAPYKPSIQRPTRQSSVTIGNQNDL